MAACCTRGLWWRCRGKLSFTEDKAPELVCQSLGKPADPVSVKAPAGKPVRPGLYLRLSSQRDPRYDKAMRILPCLTGAPQTCT